MDTADSDLRSPNWANSWIGDTQWATENIGRWALVERHGIGHEQLVGLADTLPELRKRFPEYFTEQQRMARMVHLTVDDDPAKIYMYLPERADVVYYALGEQDGVIKIGTSRWVGVRLLQLPKGRHGPWKLLAVEPGDEYVERYRHGEFRELWIPNCGRGESRELFAPGPPLMEHINALLADPMKWLERAEIDHTAIRHVFDVHVEAPTYAGATEPMGAEQVAAHQRALLKVTAEESAKFRAKIHRRGAFT